MCCFHVAGISGVFVGELLFCGNSRGWSLDSTMRVISVLAGLLVSQKMEVCCSLFVRNATMGMG